MGFNPRAFFGGDGSVGRQVLKMSAAMRARIKAMTRNYVLCARTQCGLSQAALAARLGYCEAQISEYEASGFRNMELATILRIAGAAGGMAVLSAGDEAQVLDPTAERSEVYRRVRVWMRRAREDAGVMQREMAQRLGVSGAATNIMEGSAGSVTLHSVCRWFEMLGKRVNLEFKSK